MTVQREQKTLFCYFNLCIIIYIIRWIIIAKIIEKIRCNLLLFEVFNYSFYFILLFVQHFTVRGHVPIICVVHFSKPDIYDIKI